MDLPLIHILLCHHQRLSSTQRYRRCCRTASGSSRCLILLLILLAFEIQRIHGNSRHNIEDFNLNYCKIECKSRLHTMCESQKPHGCLNHRFVNYSVQALKSYNLKARLIQGHNGLRDRIARRMNVSDMVSLVWEDSLAQMADKYSQYCTPFADDECTHFEEPQAYSDRFTSFNFGTQAHRHVAQNRYCLQAKYFARDFAELALRSWYFEKNDMKRPERAVDKSYKKELGVIRGENNFTHLAFPLAYKFGCGISRIDSYYCIFCNYYPYYRSENNTMVFESGKPGSDCPTYFPLNNTNFRHLCSNNKNAAEINSLNFILAALYIMVIILLF